MCDQADREADATMGPLAESAGNQEADANKVESLISEVDSNIFLPKIFTYRLLSSM